MNKVVMDVWYYLNEMVKIISKNIYEFLLGFLILKKI